jgi:hypothetical protein
VWIGSAVALWLAVVAAVGWWFLARRVHPATQEAAKAAATPRAKLEIVLVDDTADPLVPIAGAGTPPSAGRFELEMGRMGPGSSVQRTYFVHVGAPVPAHTRAWLEGIERPPGTRFAWGKWYQVAQSGEIELVGWRTYLLRGPAELESRHVRKAHAERDDSTGSWHVMVTLTAEGGELFEQLTKRNVERRIAIVIDDEVVTAPTVGEPIGGGVVRITMGAGAEAEQERDALRLEVALTGAAP